MYYIYIINYQLLNILFFSINGVFYFLRYLIMHFIFEF